MPTKDAKSGAGCDTARKPVQMRQQDIALAAYYRAQARGFAPGHDVEDWLAAEQDVAAIVDEAA